MTQTTNDGFDTTTEGKGLTQIVEQLGRDMGGRHFISDEEVATYQSAVNDYNALAAYIAAHEGKTESQ